MSLIMPRTTIIMPHFTSVLSTIADGIGPLLPHDATTIAQRSATIHFNRPQSASHLNSPPIRTSHIPAPQALCQQAGLPLSNNPHS
jgi:hypothetical protein